MRLIECVEGTHIGTTMDPSHLFWQDIEPIAAIRCLGERVLHAAAKDVSINQENCRLRGVLDDRFRPGLGEPALGLGDRYVLNQVPQDHYDLVSISAPDV